MADKKQKKVSNELLLLEDKCSKPMLPRSLLISDIAKKSVTKPSIKRVEKSALLTNLDSFLKDAKTKGNKNVQRIDDPNEEEADGQVVEMNIMLVKQDDDMDAGVKKVLFNENDDEADSSSSESDSDEEDESDESEDEETEVSSKPKDSLNTKKKWDHEEVQTKKRKLFGEENDSDDDESELNKKVELGIKGKKSEKLIELQSRFSHDSRFRVSEKFIDEEEDEVDETGLHEEKRQNIEILQSLIGKPVTNSRSQGLTSKTVPRFDPSAPDANQYEVTKTKKKDAGEKEGISSAKAVETEKPVVSSETYYTVDSSLKNAFKNTNAESGTFSLNTMFGSQSSSKSKPKEYKAEKLKKNWKNEKNPFKYDSSESEDERPKARRTEFSTENSIPIYKSEKFFFTKDDPRLSETPFYSREVIEKTKEKWTDLRQQMMEVIARRKRFFKRKQELATKIHLFNARRAKAAKSFKNRKYMKKRKADSVTNV
ncbi:putative RNA-binding protein [Halotydeus destructor]|nr:putative RNA-binding protein [Halotydeus destructor]